MKKENKIRDELYVIDDIIIVIIIVVIIIVAYYCVARSRPFGSNDLLPITNVRAEQRRTCESSVERRTDSNRLSLSTKRRG